MKVLPLEPCRTGRASDETEPEPAQNGSCPGFSGYDGERSIREDELEVANACEALAGYVDDLRVEHVTLEEELVFREPGRRKLCSSSQPDLCLVDCSDPCPCDFGGGTPSSTDT